MVNNCHEIGLSTILIHFPFAVCPANWSRDKNPATIKPNTKESKEYFSKQFK